MQTSSTFPPESVLNQGEYKHIWDFNALMREKLLCADIERELEN